jgi:hypothetical protein
LIPAGFSDACLLVNAAAGALQQYIHYQQQLLNMDTMTPTNQRSKLDDRPPHTLVRADGILGDMQSTTAAQKMLQTLNAAPQLVNQAEAR